MEVTEGGRDQLCRGRGGMGGEQEAVLELSIWSLMKGIICTNKNIPYLSIYLSIYLYTVRTRICSKVQEWYSVTLYSNHEPVTCLQL